MSGPQLSYTLHYRKRKGNGIYARQSLWKLSRSDTWNYCKQYERQTIILKQSDEWKGVGRFPVWKNMAAMPWSCHDHIETWSWSCHDDGMAAMFLGMVVMFPGMITMFSMIHTMVMVWLPCFPWFLSWSLCFPCFFKWIVCDCLLN